MKLPSVTVAGDLNDSITIHRTGNRAKTRTTKSAVPQPRIRFVFARSIRSRLSRAACAEALDKDDRDDQHADEDQHRHRRAQAEVESVEQLVVAQDRHRLDLRVRAVLADDV